MCTAIASIFPVMLCHLSTVVHRVGLTELLSIQESPSQSLVAKFSQVLCKPNHDFYYKSKAAITGTKNKGNVIK